MKNLALPYGDIADLVLRFSLEATSQSVMTVEKATHSKVTDSVSNAICQEIAAYHLSVVIANTMIKKHLFGQGNYEHIETAISDAIKSILTEPQWHLEHHLGIVSEDNRNLTRMYFVRDAHGLRVSTEQIIWYAERYNKPMIKDLPADQMALVYFTMRIARLVTTGQDIDMFIVHHVNTALMGAIEGLQENVNKYLT